MLTKTEQETELVDISPEIAIAWLSAVPHFQRKKDKKQIEKIARAIRAGEWRENGATIVFDAIGNLLDGQHRLEAISISGKTVRSLVVRGVGGDMETFQTIGDEKARRLADFLKCRNAHIVAAVARQVWLLERRLWPDVGGIVPPLQEQIRVIGPYIEFLEDVVPKLQDVGRITGQTAFCVFLVLYYSKIRPYAIHSVVEFFMRLGDGVGLEKHSPIWAARKRFLDNVGKEGSTEMKKDAKQGLILKALNLYLEGKTVNHYLTFRPGAEAWPVLIGYLGRIESKPVRVSEGPAKGQFTTKEKQERGDVQIRKREKGKFVREEEN